MTPLLILIVMDNWELSIAALNSLNNSLANTANYVVASNTDKDDRNFSREMTNLAWERNLEAWRMQNEYNLPTNQYARQLEGLIANGLNPNLVYGSSSSVTGPASTPAAYKFDGYHSTVVPRFPGSSLNDFFATRLLQTQVAGQEAANRLTNARADNEEARNPGISAKADEARARWNYILDHMDDQESAWRAQQALEYWKGQQAFSQAEILKNKSSMSYIEAAMAQWLNETRVPGMDITYRQYMESSKAMLPGGQYAKFKADILDIASRIAYRKKQGELLDLKQEYQGYVNRLARYGRSLGNDWVTLLISGLHELFPSFIGDDNGPGLLYNSLPGLYELDPVQRGMSTGNPND